MTGEEVGGSQGWLESPHLGNWKCLRQADRKKGSGETGEFHFGHVEWEVGPGCPGRDQADGQTSLMLGVRLGGKNLQFASWWRLVLAFYHLFRVASPKVTFLPHKSVLGVKSKGWAAPQINSWDRVWCVSPKCLEVRWLSESSKISRAAVLGGW